MYIDRFILIIELTRSIHIFCWRKKGLLATFAGRIFRQYTSVKNWNETPASWPQKMKNNHVSSTCTWNLSFNTHLNSNKRLRSKRSWKKSLFARRIKNGIFSNFCSSYINPKVVHNRNICRLFLRRLLCWRNCLLGYFLK